MRIASVEVGSGRVDAVVRLDPASPARTSAYPGLPDAVLAALPGLRRHRCELGPGTFGAEARDTELPHLLEHVALELLRLAGWPATLQGHTSWDFARDGRGVYRVAIEEGSPADAALRVAERFLGELLAGRPAPDAAAEAERLGGLRRG